MDWVQTRRAYNKTVLLPIVLSIIMACSVTASFGQASDNQPSQIPIQLNVVDQPLPTVVQLLMNKSNQGIIIKDMDELRTRKVTVSLDLPLDQLLKSVVESAGAFLEKNADGAYVVSAKGTAPVAVPATQTTLPRVEQNIVPPAPMQTSTIKLFNLRYDQAMVLLGVASAKDHPMVSTGMMGSTYNALPAPQINMPSDHPVVVNNGQSAQGNATPPLQDPLRMDAFSANRTENSGNESLQFGGGGGGFGGGGGGFGGGGFGGGGGGFGGGGGGLGGFGGGGGGLGGGQGNGFGGGQAQGYGNGQRMGLLPYGIAMIMPFPTDNSLIVQGTEDAISELRELIKKLDIAPKQIMIKTELISISTSGAERLGLDWNFTRMNSQFITNFNPQGNVGLALASGNILANLKAELSSTRATLVNSPMLITMNNVPGTISTTSQIPYFTPQTNITSGVLVTTYNAQALQIQTGLSVIPTINPIDNSITMMLQTQVSDQGAPVTGPDGTTLPTVQQQGMQALVRVQNGETFVIGGMVHKADSLGGGGIPFLKDLPVIGALFRTRNKTTDDSELLIFVTPTIKVDRVTPSTGVGIGVGGGSVGVIP